jgi:hypothetical protein
MWWLQLFPVETINIMELNPTPFPKMFNDSELMEALEHAAPDEWKAELKKQHITNFNSLDNMKWHYKDIQDAGKDLAKSSRNSRGSTSREGNESQTPRNRQSHSQNRKHKGEKQKHGRGSPSNNRAGGTTVNATNVRMSANIAAKDMTARIAGDYQKKKTSALIGGGPLKREETTTTIEESATRRKRWNSQTRLNCPKKPSPA